MNNEEKSKKSVGFRMGEDKKKLKRVLGYLSKHIYIPIDYWTVLHQQINLTKKQKKLKRNNYKSDIYKYLTKVLTYITLKHWGDWKNGYFNKILSDIECIWNM